MFSRSVLLWIFVVLLILLAAPLLGALATGSSVTGTTSIWIALLALLLVAVVISVVRSVSRKRERNKAA